MHTAVLREFEPADLSPAFELIQAMLNRTYAGVYDSPAIDFFRRYHSRTAIRVDASAGYTVVAGLNGDIVGIGSLVGTDIRRVYVSRENQRQGLGAAIYSVLEARAREQGLKLLELDASPVSRKFWERQGFEVISEEALTFEQGARLEYCRMKKLIGE
jgi:GNAT superfamily N-acetyltransferase